MDAFARRADDLYPMSTEQRPGHDVREQVFVMHQPGDDPNIADPQNLAKDGLYFTCQKLTVIQRKVKVNVLDKATGKMQVQERTTQEMIADGENGLVNFQTTEFRGSAKTVKFDDAQEVIIFEGNPVQLFKAPKVQGQGGACLWRGALQPAGGPARGGSNPVMISQLSQTCRFPGSAWERTATALPCAKLTRCEWEPVDAGMRAAGAFGLPSTGFDQFFRHGSTRSRIIVRSLSSCSA